MSETKVPGQTMTVAQWADAIAAPSPTPAGGAAAGLTLALAGALVEMVGGLTGRRERYAEVHAEARAAAERAAVLRAESLALAIEDAAAFGGFERALAMPRDTEAQRAARDAAKRAAFREGARVQQALLRRSAEIAGLAVALAERGLAAAVGDAATALFLAAAVARSAAGAVRLNLAGDADERMRALLDGSAGLLEQVEELERRGARAAEGRQG